MKPTPSDRATAEAIFREAFEEDPTVSRKWIALNRRGAIQQLAMLEMAKRQDAEWRASFQVKIGEAA